MSVGRFLQQAAAGAGKAVSPEDVFSPTIYTGNGSTQTITNDIDLAGEGGLVWTKGRNAAYSNMLFDTERGATIRVSSDSTNSQITTATSLTSFNSDGFTLGSYAGVNNNSTNFVSWAFRQAEGFFDVVKYTGQSAEMAVSHNLGVTPELILQKCVTLSSGYNWNSWYTGLTNSQYINLNGTGGVASSSNLWGTNSTVATDSVFRVGAANTGVNAGSSNTHIAYLFATLDGVSKVGTFNRPSQVAQDIDCGFTNGARFVLLKRTNTTGNWVIWDSARGIVSGNDPYTLANSLTTETTNTDYIDPLSSGFTLTSGIATGDWLFLAIA